MLPFAIMPATDAGAASGPLGMLNVFVDPRAAALRARTKLFWLWPLIALAIIYLAIGYLMLPYARQLADYRLNDMLSQQSISSANVEMARRATNLITAIAVPLTPLIVIVTIVFLAWLVETAGSMTGARATFRDVFALLSACYLILALQSIAVYFVIRMRGEEIQSQEQLAPPFGLDIFFPSLHGPAFAILNFFSLFEIWYVVILGLGFAYLTGASKAKAFAATAPAWILPLVFRVIGSLFALARGG